MILYPMFEIVSDWNACKIPLKFQGPLETFIRRTEVLPVVGCSLQQLFITEVWMMHPRWAMIFAKLSMLQHVWVKVVLMTPSDVK